jgi:hypothetical protein
MGWTGRLAILLAAASWGCQHRAVSSLDLGAAGQFGDGPIVLPDLGARRDGSTPEVCLQERPLRLVADPKGTMTLALAWPDASATPVTISGAGAGESALAIDLAPVAALAAIRPGTAAPAVELAAIQQRLAALLLARKLGGLSVRASGTTGKNHSGQLEVKEAIWDLEAAPATGVESALLRGVLLAAVLNRPESALGISTGPVSSPAPQLTIKLSVAQHGNRFATSAAVASRVELDASDQVAFVVDDLANGTALAGPGRGLISECDAAPVDGSAKADILWVIDESGSMTDNRKDIVAHANSFFARAQAAGLEIRMGVTGVKKPTPDSIPGKLCSRAPASEVADDGGEDRFLLPSEQALFSACIENPPYYEGGEEYGLTAIYWAIKRHLPRKANTPGKIREGAKLAIIVATDEAPEEVKKGGSFEGHFGFLNPASLSSSSCPLSAAHQTSLGELLRPLRELLADPSTQASLHVIGGTCNNACSAEIGVGYRELAGELGGQVGDVCQQNLNATIDVVIDSIAAAASPRVLAHVPISATLAVEGNGLQLPRSRSKGYLYNAATRSLTFVNVKLQKGDQVVASYQRFSGSL